MGPLPFTSFVFPLGNTTLNLNRILEWQKCPILPPLYSTGFSTMRRQILPFPSHPKYVYYFYLEYIYTYHLIFYTCLIYNFFFFFFYIFCYHHQNTRLLALSLLHLPCFSHIYFINVKAILLRMTKYLNLTSFQHVFPMQVYFIRRADRTETSQQ